MRDSQRCFRNSDAKSPEYEECEHDGPKSLQHMSATLQRMISRFTMADDLNAKLKDHKSKEQFQKIIKDQSEATMKNQRQKNSRGQKVTPPTTALHQMFYIGDLP